MLIFLIFLRFLSDHSIGRCLLYGVGASPVNVPCHVEANANLGKINNGTIPLVGMCFMTPKCDLEEQLTCHRYKATAIGNDVVPERISTTGSNNYRLYSSVFNGEVIDSKL